MSRTRRPSSAITSRAGISPFFQSLRTSSIPIASRAKLSIGSPYISFALSSGPAPDFKPNFTGVEEPPDLAQLEGFRGLLIRFYREAALNDLWQKLQPEYQRELARYHDPVSRAS